MTTRDFTIHCTFPACTANGVIVHDMHLLREPGSPYPMRVAGRAVYLWLHDGTLLKEHQPDAVRKLRSAVQARAAEAYGAML